jgi:hypothetical protein
MVIAATVTASRARVCAQTAQVTLGIDGVHRTGEWTPATVRMPSPGSQKIRIAVEDPDGQFVASPPVSPESDGTTYMTCLRPGRPLARVRILPEGQGSGTAESIEPQQRLTVASTTPLLLVVGKVPAAASAARLVAGDEVAMEVMRPESPADIIASDPRDLDCFDAAIVCGSTVAQLSPSTLEALDGWVQRGGRMILSAGASAMAIANSDGPARSWLPSPALRLVPLRRAGAIEAFAGASGLTARIPAAGLTVPRCESPADITGVIDVFEGASAGDLPLVVRRAHGFGTITWIAIDIDEPWCANWNGADRLVAELLGGRREADTVTPSAVDSTRRVPDLAGQLRVALDTFPDGEGQRGSQPVPFEIIAAVGILCCFVLYPLDWWFVRWSGRPWLAWVTLPVTAGFFAALAWNLGAAWGRDAPPRARAAGVVDIDTASGLVRGSDWSAVRSPDNGALSIVAAPAVSFGIRAPNVAVSWFADRGPGFGGVDALMAHPSLAANDYSYAKSLAHLEGVPIAAASSRLFEASWTATARDNLAESSLARDPRGLLKGRVTSQFPFPLEGCWLMHGGWLYDIGRLEPGDTYDTEAGRGPRSLSAALTRRAAIRDRDRAERWDAAHTDIARILEIAGLHEASGGTTYTGLLPGRLGRLDLSPILATDRAVLLATAAHEHLTAWTVSIKKGDPRSDITVERAAPSVVRVVLPVRSTGAAEEPSP